MSETAPYPYPDPTPSGLLPICVAPEAVHSLMRSLPRPNPDDPPAHGRQLVASAVGMIGELRPRNRYEAALVLQIIAAQFQARQSGELRAANQARPEVMTRYERGMVTLLRSAQAMERRLRLYRRDMLAEGYAPAVGQVWACELDALEAVWRAEPVGQEAAPAPAAKPAAKKVWAWQKNGRTYMHQILDAELDELMEAHKRGEVVEWPPYRPGDPGEHWVPDPKNFRPFRPWQEMTMDERLERYGYKHPPEFEAKRLARKAREAAEAAAAAGETVGEKGTAK